MSSPRSCSTLDEVHPTDEDGIRIVDVLIDYLTGSAEL